MRSRVSVLDLVTFDGAILVVTALGLALTTLSIVRDTRAQHDVGATDDLHAEDVAA